MATDAGSDGDTPATLETSLRITGGIEPHERAVIISRWSALDHRLRSFRDEQVSLILSVKDRGDLNQHMRLEAAVADWPRFVATSDLVDFDQALSEVRDDLIRQLRRAKDRRTPRQNRRQRGTIRH